MEQLDPSGHPKHNQSPEEIIEGLEREGALADTTPEPIEVDAAESDKEVEL